MRKFVWYLPLALSLSLAACQSAESEKSAATDGPSQSKSDNPLVAAAETRLLEQLQKPLVEDTARTSTLAADKVSLQQLAGAATAWFSAELPPGILISPEVERIFKAHYLILKMRSDILSYIPKNNGLTTAEKQRITSSLDAPVAQSQANLTYLSTLADSKGSGLAEADMQAQLKSLGDKQAALAVEANTHRKAAQQVFSTVYMRTELAKRRSY